MAHRLPVRFASLVSAVWLVTRFNMEVVRGEKLGTADWGGPSNRRDRVDRGDELNRGYTENGTHMRFLEITKNELEWNLG